MKHNLIRESKMKGLSKGLRYISQFFENEKEPEIQIGAPTDVKHVAHIGNDGPFNNAPSWMNEFHISSESLSAAPTRNGETKDHLSSGAPTKNGETVDKDTAKLSDKDSLPREIGEVQKSTSASSDGPARHNSTKTKQSKRHTNDPTLARELSEGTKPRRHKSSNSESSIRDSSDRPRRHKNSSSGSDSSAHDPNGHPKKTHRKKSKSGDSTRSSRSKESTESLTENFGNMDLGSGFELKDNETEPNPGIENHENVSLCDEISCELRAL